jgi:putative oxidoreductase
MRALPLSPDLAALAARLAFAVLFVPAGWSKIGGFAGTAGFIASKGLPLPELGAAIAVAAELGLGLLLLAGLGTRWAALGLALFVAVLTPIFHGFWGVPPEQVAMHQQAFFKNLALVGGLLALAAAGAGRYSLDARLPGATRLAAA